MPENITYDPVFKLITKPRLNSFDIFFKDNKTDISLYGAYVWSQSASASLYPLLQHLEILLRNSIDNEARRRFGDYWWDNISMDESRPNWKNFNNCIDGAKRALKREWTKKEKAKRGISSDADLPAGINAPIFRHDDIIAKTDFGAWKEVLNSAHHTSVNAQQGSYLWPRSMSKVFKQYSEYGTSPDNARESILNAINEIKEYRNRLFHHDCIWVKSKSTDSQSAIETIRHKINLIEKMINCISPITLSTLNTWGVFNYSRHICSAEELNFYINLQTRTKTKIVVGDLQIQ
nr:Abi family protein [Moritella viscosa]SHO18156.1 Putative uncharacterized protein [Moritella viscosa]